MPLRRWLAAALAVAFAAAQNQSPPPADQSEKLTPDQLNSLVSPIALYPDPLLSQVLVACTYPLEVVEANQWVEQHPNWKGKKLMKEAKKQNWDPSIQALAAFPDVLKSLSNDVNWMTQLGNAFLAQQGDVMNAVQQMRYEAQQRGRLNSTPQEDVQTQTQDGRTVIQIEPADPQVIYVPDYNPYWVWGPPPIAYPPLDYPGVDVGISWGLGCNLGLYFGSCCGWGGWGWAPQWYGGGGVIVNNYFFHRYGFNDYHGGPMWGTSMWQHDPMHRWGVPYPNRALAERYGGPVPGGFGRRGGFVGPEGRMAGNFGGRGPVGPVVRGAGRFGSPNFERPNFGRPDPMMQSRGGFFGQGRMPQGGVDRFGGRQIPQRDFSMPHSVFGGVREGGFARVQSDHGFAAMNRGGFGGFGGGGFRGGFGGGRMAMPRMAGPRR